MELRKQCAKGGDGAVSREVRNLRSPARRSREGFRQEHAGAGDDVAARLPPLGQRLARQIDVLELERWFGGSF